MSEMKMFELSPEELKEGDVEFNNSHRPEDEAYSIELSHSTAVFSGPYCLWVNGELVATFKTFKGLVGRALPHIAANFLEKVK